MARPPLPLPLPLPRPGEAIVATALAGALGLASWGCVPFLAFPGYADPFVAAQMALPLVPLAFHWLRDGLVTANNWPERGTAATPSTAVRFGGRAFLYAPAATGLGLALFALFDTSDRSLVARILVSLFAGATVGVRVWFPAAVLAVVLYGLPLRAATERMTAAYPDVVDRWLVRTHGALACGAALALAVGIAYLRAPLVGGDAPVSFATFLLFGLVAVAVPVGVALRAQRRLAARKAWPTGDLHLVPIAEQAAERLAKVPILGDGTAPTHALVRVAAVESYRSAAPAEEPLALVAVADEDAYAHATDISAKGR
jgi:hypothetical protein